MSNNPNPKGDREQRRTQGNQPTPPTPAPTTGTAEDRANQLFNSHDTQVTKGVRSLVKPQPPYPASQA